MSRFFAALLCGVYTPQLVSVMLPFALCALLVATSILLAFGARLAALGLIAGVLLQVAATTSALQDRLPEYIAGDSLVVHCHIADLPRQQQAIVVFEASCSGPVRLPRRIRLSWYEPLAAVRAGDTWQLVVRLRPPGGPSNPGRRDAGLGALASGLGATGYVAASSRNRLLSTRPTPIASLRADIRGRILDALPNQSAASVVVALATGLRHDISAEQWDRFRASGTNHLVAISGLHVGLVAAIAGLIAQPLLAMLLRAGSARRASLWLAVLAAAAFAILSGWGVPAQRAYLMLVVVAVTTLWRRETTGWEMLSLAGIVVLLVDPLASLSPGFLLSFSAVAILLWQFQPLAGRIGEPRRRFDALRRLPALQLGLFFGLLPALAVAGQGASLVAPVVNLLAVPLFSFLTVPATLMGMLLIPVGLDGPWFRFAALSVDVFDALVDNTAFVPVISTGLLFALPALAWILLPRGTPARALALLVVPAMLFPVVRLVPDGCVDAHFLDVGQGTAILVETRRQHLLYDTGPAYRGGASAASTRILPFMRHRGIDGIDTLVVSHADLDHAGGVDVILAKLSPAWVYAGEALGQIEASVCHANQSWIQDGIKFRFVHPLPGEALDGNDASCVLEVSAGSHRLLLTGDIERKVERRLLRRGLRPAEVVSVPHHGSRTSSTAAFARAVKARYAVVSAAKANRWGLPLPEVVARWEAAGSEVVHVGLTGYVRIRLCEADGVREVERYRQRQHRWWRR